MPRFFVTFLFCISIVHGERFILDGSDWSFRSNDVNYTGKGTVPGDIYTDLYNNGLISNPLLGNGDQDYRWVGWTSWIYEKTFILNQTILSSNEIVLVFDSLDTVVQGFLNKQPIFISRNQFLPLIVNIKPFISPNTTTYNLTLVFESPVQYAASQNLAYNMSHFHLLPLVCDDPEQNGECHENFIRKTQSSFSWDWGPTFATSGVAGRSYIEYFNDSSIYRVSPMVMKQNPNDTVFIVQTDVFVFCGNKSSASVEVVLNLNLTNTNISLSVNQNFSLNSGNCVSGVPTNLTLSFNVPQTSVNLWYPNGYGSQQLYELDTLVLANGNIVSRRPSSIGFRSVELFQDFLDPQNQTLGRHFYFKINGIPIFLKGSNFIPIDPFSAQDFNLRKQFLFESLKQANQNALRIWGGGLFEFDEFYHLADQYGIMIWHDHMFACNAYPADPDFFNLVEPEVRSQLYRLRHHPSIIAWAGNNENEGAVSGPWGSFKTPDYSRAQLIVDYLKLYKDLMMPIFQAVDPSRPYVMSSPSNGIESLEEGGVAVNPQSEHYGDTHSYIYKGNLWKENIFVISRCATEFGLQSIPLTGTMAHWINASDWTYGGNSLKMRQHHPGGNYQNMDMTMMHFEIPAQCSGYNHSNLINCSYANTSTVFLTEFAYLTQVFQAIGIQTEVEHYRRYRNIFTLDGKGGTMCALYWQLNDVWAAPTWASIDYDLNWKALHYYARRFYAPVIVSMYLDDTNNLQLYVVSDMTQPISGYNLRLEIYAWEKGFTPIYNFTQGVSVPALNSTKVNVQTGISNAGITLNNTDGFVIRASLLDVSNNVVQYPSILLPDYLRQITNPNYGDAVIASVTPLNSSSYSIVLSAVKIVPVLWLDIVPAVKYQNKLMYWFSDNAFTMVQPLVTVQLTIFSNTGWSKKNRTCEKFF